MTTKNSKSQSIIDNDLEHLFSEQFSRWEAALKSKSNFTWPSLKNFATMLNQNAQKGGARSEWVPSPHIVHKRMPIVLEKMAFKQKIPPTFVGTRDGSEPTAIATRAAEIMFPKVWTVIILAVVALITILMLWLRKDVVYALVIVWAVGGALYNQLAIIPVAIAAGIVLGIVAVGIVWTLLKSRK